MSAHHPTTAAEPGITRPLRIGAQQARLAPSAHRVRNTVIGVLIGADVLALAVTSAVVMHRPDAAPSRGTVVESRCIDGRITQGIDDANPDGFLAYDTGVSC